MVTQEHADAVSLPESERPRPRGYWENLDNVRRELDQWIAAHDGRFPTNDDLRETGCGRLSSAISRNHGGFNTIRALYDVKLVKRPDGYWQDWENVRRELSAWMVSHDGRFPTQDDLEGSEDVRGLAAGIAKFHGGFPAVRERMGLQPLKRPMGYWRDFDNVRREIEVWIATHEGKFPTFGELIQAGQSSLNSAIADYHGGYTSVRAVMGYESTANPTGHWKDFENVRRALEAWTAEHDGRFPTERDLKESGHTGLIAGMETHHGGITRVRMKLGVADTQVPRGYWLDFENVRREHEAWRAEHGGKIPLQGDLVRTGHSSLASAIGMRHGGFTAFRARLGLKVKRAPRGHWKDFDNVLREINVWMAAHDGRFPTREELTLDGKNGFVTAIVKFHGGLNGIRERMGIEANRKPNGYWLDFENVRRELETWIGEHDGHFPVADDLLATHLGSLSNAITKLHGGFVAVRARMGYGPVTDELVAAHADTLTQCILALKVTDTNVFWDRVKAKWVERDLKAAIEEYEQSGTVERFRALLADD